MNLHLLLTSSREVRAERYIKALLAKATSNQQAPQATSPKRQPRPPPGLVSGRFVSRLEAKAAGKGAGAKGEGWLRAWGMGMLFNTAILNY